MEPNTQLPATAGQIALLAQRCQTAMLKDLCGVMRGRVPKASQAGLFIAGVGEVHAQAFARLRAARDTMRQQLEAQFQSDWLGQECRIGKALYPIFGQNTLRVEAVKAHGSGAVTI